MGNHGHAVQELQLCLDGQQDPWHAFSGGSVALLAQLPNLQYLNISSSGDFLVADRHLYVMEFLPKLLSLTLLLKYAPNWNATTLAPLRHLRRLTYLNISVSDMSKLLMVSPTLAQLTQLQELRLTDLVSYRRPRDQDDLFWTVSQLTNLTELSLTCMLQNVPAEVASLSRLQHLHLGEAYPHQHGTIAAPMSFPASLALCSELHHLTLTSLSMASVKGWWGICRSLILLPGLSHLTITDTHLELVAPGDWAFSSHLTSMCLINCGLKKVPAAACQLPTLQHLTIQGLVLTSLDDGPYLSSLRSMMISCDEITQGLEVLRKAVRMVCLTVCFTNEDQSLKGCFAQAHLQTILPATCAICIGIKPADCVDSILGSCTSYLDDMFDSDADDHDNSF